ncbi:MAG: substrate-binding domain-containing protein [Methanosarcinales archaeon]|nr:substrate-binding domain-containing protein [Methanosarcinales archaeon]
MKIKKQLTQKLMITCILVAAFCIHPAAADSTQHDSVLKIATGSPYELGLVDALSTPFNEINNCTIEVTKAGSGASINLGREGKVDLVMVHAPEAEDEFIADGYGLNRTYIMYNDFVIVGPDNDPAEINGITDVADAYEKIAKTKSIFFSRGDNSGTHNKEMHVWNLTGITPEGDWYIITNDFMGATLEMADTQQGYFMTDRSTYIKLKQNLNLSILVEDDPILVNQYHAIAVNPEKYPDVNYEMAVKFIDYIISQNGQEIIMNFGNEEFGEPLYFAALTPDISSSTMLDNSVSTTPESSGFGVLLAIIGLLMVGCMINKRRQN